jgi:hypothetical protein
MKTQKATPEQVVAWFPDDRKWAPEDKFKNDSGHFLLIQFMDECSENWTYDGRAIDKRIVMDILNSTWKQCFLVEELSLIDRLFGSKSHIRVTFDGMYSVKGKVCRHIAFGGYFVHLYNNTRARRTYS